MIRGMTREEAIELARRACKETWNEKICKQIRKALEPKTGHWIINEDEENTVHGHCSVCGWEAHYYEDDIIGMSYCPDCGAKMVEPQESEGT